MERIPLEPIWGKFGIRDKKGRTLTSRIVIPIAYISVSLEGSCFASFPVNPNLSGKNNSGAIHRVVPFILPSRTVVLLVVSSTIAASPKSAKRARHSESIRTLTLRDHSVSSQIVQHIKNSLPSGLRGQYLAHADIATRSPHLRAVQTINVRQGYHSPFTHETQAIVILVGLDEVHDISVVHSF